jgi:hypothetical protein
MVEEDRLQFMVEEDRLHETVMKICLENPCMVWRKRSVISFALEKLDQRTYVVDLFWASFVRTWVTGVLPARVYQSLSIYLSVYLTTYIHTYIHTYLSTNGGPTERSIYLYKPSLSFVHNPIARARERVLFKNKYKGITSG